MNIVKLVILFCDHCVLLCNMCKRFGILLLFRLLFLCPSLFAPLPPPGPTGQEAPHGFFFTFSTSDFLWFLKHFDQAAQKGAGPAIRTIISVNQSSCSPSSSHAAAFVRTPGLASRLRWWFQASAGTFRFPKFEKETLNKGDPDSNFPDNSRPDPHKQKPYIDVCARAYVHVYMWFKNTLGGRNKCRNRLEACSFG